MKCLIDKAIFVVTIVLASCGPKEGAESGLAGEELGGEQVAEDIEQDEAGAESDGLCLLGCDVPREVSFTFTAPIHLTPENCDVKSMRVLDNLGSLMVFFQGDCGSGDQAYVRQASYNGDQLGALQLLSDTCADHEWGIDYLEATRGIDNFMTVFSCLEEDTTYRTCTRMVGASGALGDEQIFESFLKDDYWSRKWLFPNMSYFIKWNPAASAYGLARKGRFQRFDSDGKQVGGSVLAASNRDGVSSLGVAGANWYIFSSGRSVQNNHTYCSKISPVGMKGCDEVQLNGSGIRLIGSKSVSSLNRYDDHILSTFNGETCTTSKSTSLGKQDDGVLVVFGAAQLTPEVAASLVQTKNDTLSVTYFSLTGTKEMLGSIAVENAKVVGSATIDKISDRIVIDYVVGGKGAMILSGEKISAMIE
jgi:hypothetical protein